MRKQKQQVYDQYLWRKLLIADFQAHSAFMMSPGWEAAHAAKVARWMPATPACTTCTQRAAPMDGAMRFCTSCML